MYSLLAADDLFSQVVLERMLAGVATRRHPWIAEPIGEAVLECARSTGRSAVSRRFVKQTKTALVAELLARDLTQEKIKVLMLDGEHMAGRCIFVALGITADGRKLPIGLWDSATQNKAVVRSMLADLVSRGLSAEDGLLVVMDGAKALSAAVNEVFGGLAAVQRCTLHKHRNVADHLPDTEKAWVDAKLVKAFIHPDPDLGLRNAKHLAGLLDKTHPGAANSLRERLEQMFTVSRLGIDGRLARTLVTSNPVESMISIARTTDRNVTPLARRPHGTAPGRRRDAQRRAFLPQDQGLQADAPARRSTPPARPPRHGLKHRNCRNRRLGPRVGIAFAGGGAG